MGKNISGLRRGNKVKEEQALGYTLLAPSISDEEVKEITMAMKSEWYYQMLMQPGKDYCII